MLETVDHGSVEQISSIEKSVSTILTAAEALLSRGSPATESVVAYIREMQRADVPLARAAALAREEGRTDEARRLERKRRDIDDAVAKEITAITGRIGRERDKTIATLNAVFKLGHAPDVAPSGPFRGQLLSPTLFVPLDAFGRFVARFYIPWKGKRFDATNAMGRNIFTASALITGRLFWPFYSSWKRYKKGYYTGFTFDTYTGPGAADPELSTFKLDYDNPGNPRFLVRSVLDELVQITGGYYLGKALLWRPDGHYKLAAFFVLRRSE
jgi:hypothetical protein